jgi:integrase
VFPNPDGRMIDGASFRRLFQRASKRAGVNHGLHVNDLRHTAAAFAVGQGADVIAVSKMLGGCRVDLARVARGFRIAEGAALHPRGGCTPRESDPPELLTQYRFLQLVNT